jgi:hypothetical protein
MTNIIKTPGDLRKETVLMSNGFQGFVSNRHGKYYTSFVPMNEDIVLGVAIMGPYKTQRKAKKILDKWACLNKRLMDADQELHFVDMTTVPADVRTYITEQLTTVIQQLGFSEDNVGVTFGPKFQ